MDLCDSPRGFVGARLVRFIRGERAMMMPGRFILSGHVVGFFIFILFYFLASDACSEF